MCSLLSFCHNLLLHLGLNELLQMKLIIKFRERKETLSELIEFINSPKPTKLNFTWKNTLTDVPRLKTLARVIIL